MHLQVLTEGLQASLKVVKVPLLLKGPKAHTQSATFFTTTIRGSALFGDICLLRVRSVSLDPKHRLRAA